MWYCFIQFSQGFKLSNHHLQLSHHHDNISVHYT